MTSGLLVSWDTWAESHKTGRVSRLVWLRHSDTPTSAAAVATQMAPAAWRSNHEPPQAPQAPQAVTVTAVHSCAYANLHKLYLYSHVLGPRRLFWSLLKCRSGRSGRSFTFRPRTLNGLQSPHRVVAHGMDSMDHQTSRHGMAWLSRHGTCPAASPGEAIIAGQPQQFWPGSCGSSWHKTWQNIYFDIFRHSSIIVRHSSTYFDIVRHSSTCFDMFPVAIFDPEFEEKTSHPSSFLSEQVQWLTVYSSLAIACNYSILEQFGMIIGMCSFTPKLCCTLLLPCLCHRTICDPLVSTLDLPNTPDSDAFSTIII